MTLGQRGAKAFRTITCWAVYRPKVRAIITGFRTKKEMKRFYSAGIPIGCVVVKMQGHYANPSNRGVDK